MSQHIKNKRIIQSICSKLVLKSYIDDCCFDGEHDCEILSMIYLQNKNCGYIADKVGLSYAQTLERHRAAAEKLARLINTDV